MKSTPDVPPALREIAEEIRRAADAALVLPSTNPEDCALIQADNLRDIAKRLEEIAGSLSRPWTRR